MFHTSRTTGFLIAAMLVAAATGFAREKIDVVTLRNGDRVTGEIRQLAFGQLSVKTDAMGTISIEWPDVQRIESKQLFEVEDDDGEKYHGVITPADEQGQFMVLGVSGWTALEHDRIVRIAAMDEDWTDRWKGFVDLGFSYHSANHEAQGSLGAEATYRSKKFRIKNTLTVVHSERDPERDPENSAKEESSWTTVTSRYERFLRNRWFWMGLVGYEQDEERQLDMRATVGGGFGRYLIQTSRSVLGVNIGLAVNRERYFEQEQGADEGDDPSVQTEGTWDAFLQSNYDLFLFGERETVLSLSLTVLPSLSTSGRYRVESKTSFRREMFGDFTVSLSIEDSYDSEPPAEGTTKNDVRIMTSLGWTF